MEKSRADFTNTFRDLSTADLPGASLPGPGLPGVVRPLAGPARRDGSPKAAAADRMRAANPAVIPRNHRVEEALAAAEEAATTSRRWRASDGLASPFEPTGDWEKYGTRGQRVWLPYLLRDIAVRHRGGYHLPRSVLPTTGSDSWRRRVAAADR